MAVAEPKTLFEDTEKLENIGLDVPLTAKILSELLPLGLSIDCDFTSADFVKKFIDFAKTRGAGMRLPTKGGQKNA